MGTESLGMMPVSDMTQEILVVKNLPCDAGNASSIPDQRTKIPHTEGQLSLLPLLLSPRAPALMSNNWRVCGPQQKILHKTREIPMLQLRPDPAK